MARLTKYLVKISVNNAVTGSGNGESQLVRDRPKNEAFRRVLDDRVRSGGRMFGQVGVTLHGDPAPGRTLLSPDPYNPLHVSIDPLHNPYLDYLSDKISEGVGQAHQNWQAEQRVRGQTHSRDAVREWDTTLPFQTANSLVEMSDFSSLGKMTYTGQVDFQSYTNPMSLIPKMFSSAVEGFKKFWSKFGLGDSETNFPAKAIQDSLQVEQDSRDLAGDIPGNMLSYQQQASTMAFPSFDDALGRFLPQTHLPNIRPEEQLAEVSEWVKSIPLNTGDIFGDIGKWAGPIGPFPPMGAASIGTNPEVDWENVVGKIEEEQKKILPTSSWGEQV